MLSVRPYSEILRVHGRTLVELGRPGVGLDRMSALAALEALRAAGGGVPSGEIVLMACDYPQYVCETWECEPVVGETPEQYARRSVLMAEELVRAYADPMDGSVLYVFQGVESEPGV